MGETRLKNLPVGHALAGNLCQTHGRTALGMRCSDLVVPNAIAIQVRYGIVERGTIGAYGRNTGVVIPYENRCAAGHRSLEYVKNTVHHRAVIKPVSVARPCGISTNFA